MSGTPRKYKGLNLKIDLDDVRRVFVHKGITGESLSFRVKSPEDEELLAFDFPYDLDEYLSNIDKQITNQMNRAAKATASAEALQAKAQESFDKAKENAEAEISEKYKQWKSDYEAKCKEAVRKAMAERDAAIAEKEKTQRQNDNLMRIMRERANAKRGLTPKKERSGYILLDTGPATYKYVYNELRTYVRNGVVKTTGDTIEKVGSYKCYKSVFETPINFLVEEDTAFSQIYEAWRNGIWGHEGDCYWKNVASKGSIKKDSEGQLIFDWSMKPDVNSGLWKITIWHHEPLDPIRENLKKVSA